MDLKLKNKKVLITGGSAGIGLAVAEALAAEGCELVLVSRTEASLKKAADQIREKYVVSVACEALDMAIDTNAGVLAAKHPGIDILVNNAGGIPRGDIAELNQARWREAWDLKVFGFIGMTREFYQLMAARGNGVILNIIGSSATSLDSKFIAGSMANNALEAMTKSLGASAPDHGVRVLGISPGVVLTDRLRGLLKGRAIELHGDENRWQELMQKFPFKRPAAVDEIASAAAFFVSPLSGYTSGVVLTMDAGFSHRRDSWG